MSYLLGFLSAFGGPVAVILVLAIAIWFGGAQFNMPVSTRIWLIAAVAVCVLLFVGIKALVEWRRRKRIQKQLDEAAGVASAPSGPTVDLSVEARVARLCNIWRSDDATVLAKPWYVVIGPRGSGRKSLLKGSGCDLRDAGEDFEAGDNGIKEASFMRGEHAVFVAPDSELIDGASRDDLDDLLRAIARSGCAVAGVVLTVDLPGVLDGGEDEVAARARGLRERYDQVAENLGLVFPVYLTFTQCDQLHGFTDYFDHLDKSARAKALGLLLPYQGDEAAAVLRGFGERFDRLYEGIRLRRLAGLASDDLAGRERTTRFPVQFLAIKPRIELFLQELLSARPRMETGVLRGCFFTSTVQDGTTRDRALGSWDPELAVGSGAHAITVGDQRSYFAAGLIGDVLPNATGLAYPREADARRARRQVYYSAAASIAVAALLLVAFAVSFVGNANLLASLAAPASQLKPEHSGTTATTQLLQDLEPLRERLVELESYDAEGAPLRLRWGLYHGGSAYALLREAYYARVGPDFIQPTMSLLAKDLIAAGDPRGLTEVDAMFERYMALAMLAGELPADDEMGRVLAGAGDSAQRTYWRDGVFQHAVSREESDVAMADAHLDYFTTQYPRQGEWSQGDWLNEAYPKLLETKRGQLTNAKYWAELSFQKLLVEVERAKGDINLNQSMAGMLLPRDAEANSLFRFDTAPRQLFSRTAYNNMVEPAIVRTAKELERRFGALHESVDAEAFTEQFVDAYADHWTRAWRGALQGLEVREANSIDQAYNRLLGIGDAYRSILSRIADEQVLKVSGFDDRNQPSFQPDGEWLSTSLAELQTLALAIDLYRNQTAAGDRLRKLEELTVVAEAVTAAQAKIAEQVLTIGDEHERTQIKRHFDEVLHMAVQGIGRDLAREADGLWHARIVAGFADGIGRKFPFTPDAEESVSVIEFTAFFDDTDGVVGEVKASIDAVRAVETLGGPIIQLGQAYPAAVARLAEMGKLFPAGDDGKPAALPIRVRLIQHPGVEDITLTLGASTVSLYDAPDHRSELPWTFGDDQNLRVAIRVNRDDWKERRASQDAWGPLRLINSVNAEVVKTGLPTRVRWVFSAEEAAPAPVVEPIVVAAPPPAAPVSTGPVVETAVAPEVRSDPVPEIDNPAKMQVPEVGSPSRAERSGRSQTRRSIAGYSGNAKTGGQIKVEKEPKSLQPVAPPPPVARTQAQYVLEIEFTASGVPTGLFDGAFLTEYAPPASIQPTGR
ncbi:MAG: hypothetical protein PF961_17515 [Planctomycetota bacterium]|jgi:type VI protein secretion system component VasK|nr:hypothetical protein [Planctomycetota bacterium]